MPNIAWTVSLQQNKITRQNFSWVSFPEGWYCLLISIQYSHHTVKVSVLKLKIIIEAIFLNFKLRTKQVIFGKHFCCFWPFCCLSSISVTYYVTCNQHSCTVGFNFIQCFWPRNEMFLHKWQIACVQWTVFM